MLLITTGLTTTSLLLVQRSIRRNVRQSIAVNLRNSVAAFQDFRHERETMLTSDVALLADLPITRAIMTSPDPVTIQDASQDISQIAASDLFVMVDRSGRVVALHTKTPGFTKEAAEKYFQQSLDDDRGESSHWWLGDHHLYQTFIEPIYRGSRTERNSARIPRHRLRDQRPPRRRSQQGGWQPGGIFLRQRNRGHDADRRHKCKAAAFRI